ncbi:MAG TPA: toxin-antitoxin system YwqK family antitoxin [Bacteroidia bacterium]|jgi:antitoxin component YwqK of YwqJK toxin-antitoxin module|nr:toxin-antitoxin system YwqK family antitoxin [Bacteroidia bacterium]
MKPLLIIILSLSLSIAAFGQQDSLGFTDSTEAKNLIINGLKQGKWVEDIDETEYPMGQKYYCLTVYRTGIEYGIQRGYYMSGKLYFITSFKNGKQNGLYKEYFENGILSLEEPFTYGLTNGIVKGYDEDGKLTLETPYSNGKINGVQKEYYENGNIEKETPYKNGDKDGLIKEYYENGGIKSISIDTDYVIKKMIIGVWVSTDNADNIWVITPDTIKSKIRNFCGADYSIYRGQHPYRDDEKVAGKYWFVFDYVACGNSDITNRPDYDVQFSIDSTTLTIYNSKNDEAFIYKRKRQ